MDKTINELEGELRQRKYEEAEAKRRKERQLEEDFIKSNHINVYSSDDYAGLDTEIYSFYYGYEVTECPKHKNKDCEDNGCELREWCFVVTQNDRHKPLFKRRTSQLWQGSHKDVSEYLLLGIGQFLSNSKVEE